MKWNSPESCFVFDQKRPPGDKDLFLLTFYSYFMLACFTYFSLLPEVPDLSVRASHEIIKPVSAYLGEMSKFPTVG